MATAFFRLLSTHAASAAIARFTVHRNNTAGGSRGDAAPVGECGTETRGDGGTAGGTA